MTDPTELIDQLINKPQALTMSTRRQCASVIARLSTDIEALCGLVIECRSSVRLDLENYERVIDDMDRSDQQRAAAYEAVSKERTRLFRLLAKIDALTPSNANVTGLAPGKDDK